MRNYWIVIFMIKRIFTSVIIVYMRDVVVFQLMSLTLLSVIYQALILRYKFYQKELDIYLELFNELTISLCLYCFYMLSDFSDQLDFKLTIGYTLIGIILFNVTVYMLISSYYTIIEFKIKCPKIK